jgi:rRNA maturation protein Nop10
MTSAASTSIGYCRKCGYDLRSLAENRCPECGKAFDPANPSTFSKSPRGFRWRFWIRLLLIPPLLVALVYAILIGWVWWGWKSEQAVREAKDNNKFYFYANAAYRGPPWLRKHLGDSFDQMFLRCTGVYITAGAPDDDLRECIIRLEYLEELYAGETQLTDADIAKLSRNIRVLQLWSAVITDGGIEHIVRMKNLRDLKMQFSRQVTIHGFDRLATMRQLESLGINGTNITNDVLLRFGGMKQLTRLSVSSSRITEDGLSVIIQLKKLEDLDLSFVPGVRDTWIEQLASLPNLEKLDLSFVPVTDDCLVHLYKMPQLKYLQLVHTGISPLGIRKLQEALPSCRIRSEHLEADHTVYNSCTDPGR